MAGTATLTTTQDDRQVKKYSVAWTSTAGGAVSANAFTLVQPGYLIRATVMPNLAGSQPTDLYDLTLVDAESIDVLNGMGANRSNAAGHIFTFDPPVYMPLNSTLDVVIANAGNAKTGRVDIYVEGQRV